MWLPTTSLTQRAAGAAPAELAWRRYDELALWSTWSPQVQDVEADGERLRAGLTGDVIGPLGVRVPFQVTYVGQWEWTWQVRLPLGVHLDLHHAVTATATGSATLLRTTGPVPLVLGYAPLAQVALHRLVSS